MICTGLIPLFYSYPRDSYVVLIVIRGTTVTAYRPKFVKQLDGSKYAGLNCTCAAGAMALDRDTLGHKTSTGAIIRNWTGDTVGGTRQVQVADAIERAYGVELDVETPILTADALRRLDAGQGMMLAGQSAATRGTKWQASETFTGNHQWYDNERRKNSSVAGGYEHLIYDPLADGRRAGIAQSPMWIPENVVLDFARRLDIDGLGTRLGYGRFYAVFTHDTEPHLVLRYGGTALKPPQVKTIHVPAGHKANVRRRPTTEAAIVNRKANGSTFTAYQVTKTGQSLGGSRTWYGNIDGSRWLHVTSF